MATQHRIDIADILAPSVADAPAGAGWTVIVLAGQRPGTDPLAAAFGEKAKALVRIAGRAMLDRVLETVLSTPAVARVVVLGQSSARLRRGAAHRDDPRVTWAEASSGISASLRTVVGSAIAPWPVLVTTADHPLLTREMVESFLTAGGDEDVAVAMVESATILASYPETKRTWLRFRDGAWSGANLFTLRGPAAVRALDLWSEVEQNRKRPLRLFWRFGPLFTLRALTRSIGLGDALTRVGRRFGVKARLIPLDYAEAAIDVDKPGDHALAERILQASGRG
jgi:GTP:adenosylcobinamide-phosphate guanylyltransferase